MSLLGRTIFMTRLKEVALRVAGGKYFVKRGYINWATWNFDAHPQAMSLMLDEHQFMASQADAVISIECFTRIKSGDAPEIDDVVLDGIVQDLAAILDQMEEERDRQDPAYPVAFAIKRGSAKAVEAHDAEMRIQGVTATFEASF